MDFFDCVFQQDELRIDVSVVTGKLGRGCNTIESCHPGFQFEKLPELKSWNECCSSLHFLGVKVGLCSQVIFWHDLFSSTHLPNETPIFGGCCLFVKAVPEHG